MGHVRHITELASLPASGGGENKISIVMKQKNIAFEQHLYHSIDEENIDDYLQFKINIF